MNEHDLDSISATHHHPGGSDGEEEQNVASVEDGRLETFVPAMGQSFGSFREIELLLDAFARANSFMIIIMRSQRPGGKVVQATFGCYKSGSYRPNRVDPPNKRTIKTNCPFQINVRYSEKNDDYRITKVDLSHNHDLDLSDVRPNVLNRSVRRRGEDPLAHFGTEIRSKRPRASRLPKTRRMGSLDPDMHPFYDGDLDIDHGHLNFDLLYGLELPDDIARDLKPDLWDT